MYYAIFLVFIFIYRLFCNGTVLAQYTNSGWPKELEIPVPHSNCPKIDNPAQPIMLRYPKDCRKYYLCAGGLAYENFCPLNLYWSDLYSRCDRIELATCETIIPSPRPECKTISYKSFPSDCNRFYEICERSCSNNNHWNAQTQRCDLPSLAGCQIPAPLIAPTPTPPSTTNTNTGIGYIDDIYLTSMCNSIKQVFLPYPGNCSKFIHCDYKPFVKHCPPFLFWNSKLTTCDKICL